MSYSAKIQALKLNLTSNNKFSRTLCLAKTVDCNNFIFTTVLWSDSKNVHGAHAKWVGDVIVVVWVDADVVQVPGYSGRRASSDSTCHVELVAFRWCVHFKRDQDRWRPLKADSRWINSIWSYWNLMGEIKEGRDWYDHWDHVIILLTRKRRTSKTRVYSCARYSLRSYLGLGQHSNKLTLAILACLYLAGIMITVVTTLACKHLPHN